ncbi:MAG: hypothetical protein IMY73_02180, partial [Bacteroidetes bacterium]|nr:hypothetical protein [Bacteroidota bacterium]
MKKTLLIATIMAMATFSSCSKNEVVDVNRNSDKMSFGAHVGSATKAIVTDATNFTAYNLYGYQTDGNYVDHGSLADCYIDNEAFIKTDNSWSHE